MSETDTLKAEVTGLKNACGHLRLNELEAQRALAYSDYSHAASRMELLDWKIDVQRRALGLASKPGCEYIRNQLND